MKTITIKAAQGLYEIETPSGRHTSATLEGALAKASPAAPPERMHHCSEVLEGMLGPLDHIQVHTGQVSG